MSPITHGNRVMGHMGNVACPLLDLYGGRVMGYMSIRGRVMGHMGDGNRGVGTHCHNNA